MSSPSHPAGTVKRGTVKKLKCVSCGTEFPKLAALSAHSVVCEAGTMTRGRQKRRDTMAAGPSAEDVHKDESKAAGRGAQTLGSAVSTLTSTVRAVFSKLGITEGGVPRAPSPVRTSVT
jgi:hypothetical protein